MLFGSVVCALALVLPLGSLTALDIFLHTKFLRTGGVNIWGYRGPIVRSKRTGERRVVVLGGSTAFGYGVGWQEAISARLEQQLNTAGGQRYSVVNIAYNNEGAYSFRYTLEDYLYLDYDVAVLYEGYNDLMGDPTAPNFSVFRHGSPVFRLTGYLPILPIVLREKAASMLYRGDINQLYIEARTGKRVAFDASLADRTKAGALNATAAIGEAIERQLGHFSPTPRPAIVDPTGTGCKYPWAEYCRSVMNGVTFALQHGARVLVVTEPYLLGESRARHIDQQETMLEGLRRRFGADRRLAYFNAGPLVDLADPTLSFDRMHLTAPGNDRVAQALARPISDLFSSQ